MMKKILLSIITMAIVASNSAYAANSTQKDILVEVEISEPLILTKADGSPFNSIQLEYNSGRWNGMIGYHARYYPAKFTAEQPIKITATQGTKIKISLAENFYMSDIKGGNGLLSPDVFIDENILQDVDDDHEFTPDKGVQELRVEAEVLEDAKPGDKYTGVLKLVMESVP